MVTIGGGDTEMADIKCDVSWSKFSCFRVTIDRVDQGRVAVLAHMPQDSNGHLRLALNSSALGPGQYQVLLEGLDWRGDAARRRPGLASRSHADPIDLAHAAWRAHHRPAADLTHPRASAAARGRCRSTSIVSTPSRSMRRRSHCL